MEKERKGRRRKGGKVRGREGEMKKGGKGKGEWKGRKGNSLTFVREARTYL